MAFRSTSIACFEVQPPAAQPRLWSGSDVRLKLWIPGLVVSTCQPFACERKTTSPSSSAFASLCLTVAAGYLVLFSVLKRQGSLCGFLHLCLVISGNICNLLSSALTLWAGSTYRKLLFELSFQWIAHTGGTKCSCEKEMGTTIQFFTF